MALSTYGVTLKWGEAEASVAKKVDIKDIPDLIGAPNMLETTTLSDAQQTYIPGLKAADVLAFTANYTSADFAAVQADEGKDLFYVLEISDGSKFKWKGRHTTGITGKGVDEVMDFTINIAPSSTVTFSAQA